MMPTKNSSRQVVSPQALATVEKMQQAAQLRAAGLSYREIGKQMNLDFTWVRELVVRALEEAKYEAADVMRTQEGMRLDRLQRSLWPAALSGDVAAARAVLGVMERRAKLFGLDSPVKVEAELSWAPDDVEADVRRLEAMLRDEQR